MLGKYFDYNATTPLREEVASIVCEGLTLFGNPSSTHTFGQITRKKIEIAREQVANLIGANSSEIVFTSGGTESINTVFKSICVKNEQTIHIITSQIEHSATLEVCSYLASQGIEVSYLPVDSNGIISIDDLKQAIRHNTVLVSLMYANNETGTLQAIQSMAIEARKIKKDIFFHVDAVQAVGKVPINVKDLEIDALSMSSHKLYGPKGIGALYLKDQNHLPTQLIHGGGQEFGIRGGTENVIGIIGFGEACRIAETDLFEEYNRTLKLKKYFLEKMNDFNEDFIINGAIEDDKCLPNTINIAFLNVRAEALAAMLSEIYGIAVSIGAACSSEKVKLSHVLLALGLSEERVKSSIRISFGHYTDYEDINYLVDNLIKTVKQLRSMLPVV
ncbi:MAG: cysteine desulfurase family protein [Psychrobacillus sp.]